MGKERPAAGSIPFDWTFLLFPSPDQDSPRRSSAEAAAWLAARGSGEPFLDQLSEPRIPDGADPTPLFDTLRAVRVCAPSDWITELTAIQLARRAVTRWTRSTANDAIDPEGQLLLETLLRRVAQGLEGKPSSDWTAEVSERCEALVQVVDDALARGSDTGNLVWREARLVERRMFAELDRGARVWSEAAEEVHSRFDQLHGVLTEEANKLLARPQDGYQLLATALAELRALLADRARQLKLRIDDASHAEAGTRLRRARTELRKQTHSPPSLLGRLRKTGDMRVFDAFGEWVRWVPRFALHQRDQIGAQVELDALGELLPPLDELLDDARQRGAALVMVLNQMQAEAAAAVLDAPGDFTVFPGGGGDPVEAASHLCDAMMARAPALDTLPGELAGPELLESDDVESSARRLLGWALPFCDAIRGHMEIDAVIAGAPQGSPGQATLDQALDEWLAPLLEQHQGRLGETQLVAGMPAHAIGGELDQLLRERAASHGFDVLHPFALPGETDLLLFRLDLGFPLWRIASVLDPLRRSYEQLRFGDRPATLHTRADVTEWAEIDRP